ncbi:MAG: hypothetical protein WA136_04225, partial [Rhodoferax sp.]
MNPKGNTYRAILGILLACFAGVGLCAERPVQPDDVRWINRLTYGLDSTTLAQYRTLGRKLFLEQQLAPARDTLPAAAQSAIDALTVSTRTAAQLLADADVENRRINALPDG